MVLDVVREDYESAGFVGDGCRCAVDIWFVLPPLSNAFTFVLNLPFLFWGVCACSSTGCVWAGGKVYVGSAVDQDVGAFA
jgi:hypothetical protein